MFVILSTPVLSPLLLVLDLKQTEIGLTRACIVGRLRRLHAVFRRSFRGLGETDIAGQAIHDLATQVLRRAAAAAAGPAAALLS